MKPDSDLLAAQRERLDRLRVQSEEVRVLRDRERELEIECISAQAALKASTQEGIPDISLDLAAEIAHVLEKKNRLEVARENAERGTAQGVAKERRELARLTTARDALLAWLEAPATARRQDRMPVVRGVLLALVLAVAWAAVTVHIALLVLVVPLALVSAFLRQSSQNLSWLRLGAERQFSATRLRAPATWETPAVEARVPEIEGEMDALSQAMEERAEARETEELDPELLQVEITQADALLNSLLARTGMTIDSVHGELERWLTLVRQSRDARRALEKVQAKWAATTAETEAEREELFRFLSRQGQAPPAGRADLDALEAGLERVAALSAKRP